MDIFTYFQADHEHIEQLLRNLISNYNRLAPNQVFDQASRIFASVRVHFDKQDVLLLKEVKDVDGLQSLVQDCLKDRRKILDAIDDAVNLHVDEPEFRQSMKEVLDLIEDHIKFSDSDLYDAIRKEAPPAVIHAVNEKLATAILS